MNNQTFLVLIEISFGMLLFSFIANYLVLDVLSHYNIGIIHLCLMPLILVTNRLCSCHYRHLLFLVITSSLVMMRLDLTLMIHMMDSYCTLALIACHSVNINRCHILKAANFWLMFIGDYPYQRTRVTLWHFLHA